MTDRTTGCLNDRSLKLTTDTGFYVPLRVGYNFWLAKLLEKPSGTLWWMSTFSPVENQNDLKLNFKVFYFADSCCSDIVFDESN